MPHGILINRIILMVFSLAKLHNFCIEQNDVKMLTSLACDSVNIEYNQGIGAVLLQNVNNPNIQQQIPLDLIRGSHHCDDVTPDQTKKNSPTSCKG